MASVHEKRIAEKNQKKDELSKKLAVSQPSSDVLALREAVKTGKVLTLSEEKINKIITTENIRKNVNLNSDEFKLLVTSIEKYGILQSIVVEYREINPHQYDLICISGHRRLAALKSSNQTTKSIAAKIVQFRRAGASAGLALSENINREDLTFMDVAEGYNVALSESNMSKQDLAEIFEKNERTVDRYLTIGKWPKEAKELVRENPQIFTARVLLKDFAAKSYLKNEEKLINDLSNRLNQNKTSFKEDRWKKNQEKLNQYYEKNMHLSDSTKASIKEALQYFKLIPK